MKEFIISLTIAAAITSIFTCRFRIEKQPRLVVGYFAFVLLIEWIADIYLIPEGALGYEIAVVCTVIAVLFFIALKVIIHLEKNPQVPFSQRK